MLFVKTSLYRGQAGAVEISKRDIGKEILAGLDEIAAWKRGELKLKTTKVALPKAADVPAIRARLGLSQEAFATCMGVSVGTLRNWEQGRREPQGPARALLLIADRKPRAFLEAVQLARRERRAA
jgi:putative transcriptional regulator